MADAPKIFNFEFRRKFSCFAQGGGGGSTIREGIRPHHPFDFRFPPRGVPSV